MRCPGTLPAAPAVRRQESVQRADHLKGDAPWLLRCPDYRGIALSNFLAIGTSFGTIRSDYAAFCLCNLVRDPRRADCARWVEGDGHERARPCAWALHAFRRRFSNSPGTNRKYRR